jgi:hypothetical protein
VFNDGAETQDGEEAVAGERSAVPRGDREQFFSRESFAAPHFAVAKRKAARALATADVGQGVVDALEILETSHPLLMVHAHFGLLRWTAGL